MWQYLAEPAAIGHVHWNDNDPLDPRGRDDMHLPVGQGTIPRPLHRALRDLPAASLLLEHFVDLPTLDGELAFIAGL